MEDKGKLIKAHIVGPETDPGTSRQLPEDVWRAEYEAGAVVEPPYDLRALAELYETNATHKACVDAKATNIVGLGFRFVPAGLPGAEQQAGGTKEANQEELQRLQSLFHNCNPEMTFTEVLRAVWTDVEVTGNGYMEVTRNGRGDIDGFYHMPAPTVRVKADRSGFVQIRETKKRHFKNIGDPDPRVDPLTREPQSEVMHFKKYTPRSSYYGIPDIVAALPAAAGDKAAREYNVSFFEHNTVPRMAIVVENGRLDDDLLNAIRHYMEREVREKTHRTLVLDVPGNDVKVRFEKLGMEQTDDAAFLEYRRTNRDEILMVHRVPPSKITIVENANLANSRDQDKTFREQVVRPEQRRIEFQINRMIREQMGISTWRFEFVEMDLSEAKEDAEIAQIYAGIGVWTPEEIRARMGL